jgi:dTDP-4-dehydrorhamnose reductase
VDASRLQATHDHHSRLPARRPRYSALGSHRAFPMPTLDDALQRYVRQAAH